MHQFLLNGSKRWSGTVSIANMWFQAKKTPLTTSFANLQKFWPQNTKVAPKKSQRLDTSAAEFSTKLAKSGRKEADFFLKFVLNTKG
jgi:hypothetical protein